MEPILILWLFIGWLSYWVTKIPSTIIGESPINTVKEFFSNKWKEIFVSIICGALVCSGVNDIIPVSWGQISNPLTAFMAGGMLPSVSMNILPFFKKS